MAHWRKAGCAISSSICPCNPVVTFCLLSVYVHFLFFCIKEEKNEPKEKKTPMYSSSPAAPI